MNEKLKPFFATVYTLILSVFLVNLDSALSSYITVNPEVNEEFRVPYHFSILLLIIYWATLSYLFCFKLTKKQFLIAIFLLPIVIPFLLIVKKLTEKVDGKLYISTLVIDGKPFSLMIVNYGVLLIIFVYLITIYKMNVKNKSEKSFV